VSPPRVGVNLLWLAPGEVGGSEDYCIGLLRAVARRRPDPLPVDLVVYLNREVAAAYPDLSRSFTTRVAPVSGRRRPTRVAIEHTWLLWTGHRDGLDVVHHLGGTMPFVRSAPGVVLVHDLQAWAMPQNFSVFKRAYLRATVPPSARHARAITTLSRWVGDDVHERFDVPRSRFSCLPPGAARLVGEDVRLDDEAVLARYDIGTRPFFLYPVITYPHKNHETLIRAFAPVARDHPEVLLVLPGGEGPSEADVRRAIEREKVADRVRRIGRVPNGVLDVLYRTTRALTFPSRYEGFGMSLLEVMNHGRPVVASDVTALPEVVGDGGTLVGPDDVEGWTAAMARLLDDQAHWQERADAARNRAASFSWDRSVDHLLDLYGRVAAGPIDGTTR
jgi:alpha-1,3-rhamnosyl/mannosyltransferase